MRKHWLIATVFGVVLFGLFLLFPAGGWKEVPLEECSDIYRLHAGNPHIEAAYFPKFPFGDTSTIAVTTLHALDSVGWDLLKEEYAIKEFSEIEEGMAQGKDYVSLKLVDSNIAVISRYLQTVCIFLPRSEAERFAIISHQISLNINQNLSVQ